jgi:hypothetical protein
MDVSCLPHVTQGQENGQTAGLAGSCCREKSQPIPQQRYFCAANPICQNYFKKEKGEETRKKKKKRKNEKEWEDGTNTNK